MTVKEVTRHMENERIRLFSDEIGRMLLTFRSSLNSILHHVIDALHEHFLNILLLLNKHEIAPFFHNYYIIFFNKCQVIKALKFIVTLFIYVCCSIKARTSAQSFVAYGGYLSNIVNVPFTLSAIKSEGGLILTGEIIDKEDFSLLSWAATLRLI